jgi:uncharacterized membrane protein YkvA (DUF1232 family)
MSSNKNVQGQLGMVKGLIDHGRLVIRLMRDKRVPIYLKALPLASLAYLVSPLDFIPDPILILGQLDDIAAILVGVETFIKLCPQNVVAEHRAELGGDAPFTEAGSANKDTIDGKWRTK